MLVPVIGLLSYKYMFYTAICIVFLLFLLIFSYRQTIDCYPNGGGSYIVAKDNLGVIPGLTAGAALSIDYILTVAVSTCAGTAAITSAFLSLLPNNVSITVALIILMSIGNLREIKESSRLFGIPNFKDPSQKNAKTVLMLLAAMAFLIFGGLSYLTTLYHAYPSIRETVIS